jgi:NAD(P)-dependent dehydrogenase (short-subunit alcohol dehydrogenase family)
MGGILPGKVVLISGVGPGLGAAAAEICLRDGARVVLGARTKERLDALARDLDPSGERAVVVDFDVRDPQGRQRFVDTAIERFGRVDALIQIAARQGLTGPFLETDAEDYRESYEGNLVAPLQLVRAVALAMQRNGGGSIVLIGSQSARLKAGDTIVYGASKGALVPAMRYLVPELGPSGIRVNIIEPDWTWTPRVEEILRESAAQKGITLDEARNEVVGTWPLRAMPENRDVADLAAFLASDRSRMITGQLIRVNAGHFID